MHMGIGTRKAKTTATTARPHEAQVRNLEQFADVLNELTTSPCERPCGHATASPCSMRTGSTGFLNMIDDLITRPSMRTNSCNSSMELCILRPRCSLPFLSQATALSRWSLCPEPSIVLLPLLLRHKSLSQGAVAAVLASLSTLDLRTCAMRVT